MHTLIKMLLVMKIIYSQELHLKCKPFKCSNEICQEIKLQYKQNNCLKGEQNVNIKSQLSDKHVKLLFKINRI